MFWVATTLVAAVAQTARNAMQSSLTATLGTLGATQVRFVYGLPFALVFLGLVTAFAHAHVPPPTPPFLAFAASGALAQIAGTALLLAAMQARSFSVATALSKTEAVQVALFGFAVLGDALTWWRAIAILIATAGVLIVAVRPKQKWDRQTLKPAVLGVASGAFFALASVSFRGAILALPEGVYFLRAATALVWSLCIQVAVLGVWLAIMNREALLRSRGGVAPVVVRRFHERVRVAALVPGLLADRRRERAHTRSGGSAVGTGRVAAPVRSKRGAARALRHGSRRGRCRVAALGRVNRRKRPSFARSVAGACAVSESCHDSCGML